MDLSIVICAHNAANRLEPVLAALSEQRSGGVAWETVVVANACTDGTEQLAERIAAERGFSIRVVKEPRPGLSFARRRGVEEARGQIISFVDDDNIIRHDWVYHAVQFMNEHTRAGVVGGRIKPRFVDPASKPADFDDRFAGALACWDYGNEAKLFPPPVHYPPCGAGLTMRRETLLYIYHSCGCHLTDRKGGRLTSGGDYELGLLALRMGWEAFYSPNLEMEHVLPPGRLTEAYLKRLRLGNVESELWLNYLRGKMPRCSRRWYLREAARKKLAAMRVSLTNIAERKALAGNVSAEEHELRARSAWRLFWEYPFDQVEQSIAEYRNNSSGPSAKSIQGIF